MGFVFKTHLCDDTYLVSSSFFFFFSSPVFWVCVLLELWSLGVEFLLLSYYYDCTGWEWGE
jgi:hypothetical protein